MEKFNFNFNKFEIIRILNMKEFFSELINHKYSETSGWGFADVDLSGSLVSATLLKSVTAYYRIWNAEIGEMERQYYNMVKEIRLYVDFERNLIGIEGSRADMNKLKQVLRELYWKTFLYEDLTITPFGMLELTADNHYLNSIKEVTISDFNYNNLFLGKYYARPAGSQVSIDEVRPYQDNLAKIKLVLSFDDCFVTMTISKTGTLAVECDEDVKYSMLRFLTTNLY